MPLNLGVAELGLIVIVLLVVGGAIGAIGYVAVRLGKRTVRQAVEEALDSRRAEQATASTNTEQTDAK